jgi:hypothetical protein
MLYPFLTASINSSCLDLSVGFLESKLSTRKESDLLRSDRGGLGGGLVGDGGRLGSLDLGGGTGLLSTHQ